MGDALSFSSGWVVTSMSAKARPDSRRGFFVRDRILTCSMAASMNASKLAGSVMGSGLSFVGSI